MRTNRSIPAATVIPILTYPDVRAAVTWLDAAFGLVERVRIGENHRAQLRFGDGAHRRWRAGGSSPAPSRGGRALSDGAGGRRADPL